MRVEHGAAILLLGVYITFLGWIPLLHVGRCSVVFRLDWAPQMAQNDNRNGGAGSGYCFGPVRVGWQNLAYWGLMKYQNHDNGTFNGYLTSLLPSHLFIAEYSSACCSSFTYGDEASDKL